MKKVRIGILYFSLSSALEAKRKKWFASGSRNQNKSMADFLQENTLNILNKSGLPIHHYDETTQKGHSFGERLANAYQNMFDLGYDAVIAVGNDCPQLENVCWESMVDQLNHGKCVIGPSYRQGIYILGLPKNCFSYSSFQALPWQTNQLIDQLRLYCTRQDSEFQLLTACIDLNSWNDLKCLAKLTVLSRNIRYQLLKYLGYVNLYTQVFISFSYGGYYQSSDRLRGPPAIPYMG